MPSGLFMDLLPFTGREPQRDKPTRYSALVEASTAYSQPSVTGTENYLKLNVKEKNIQIADRNY